jgi:hypothetical protein
VALAGRGSLPSEECSENHLGQKGEPHFHKVKQVSDAPQAAFSKPSLSVRGGFIGSWIETRVRSSVCQNKRLDILFFFFLG